MGKLFLDGSTSIAPAGSTYQWKINGVNDLAAVSGQSLSTSVENGDTVTLEVSHPDGETSTRSQRLPIFDILLAVDFDTDRVEVNFQALQVFNTVNSDKKDLLVQFYDSEGNAVGEELLFSHTTAIPEAFELDIPGALINQAFEVGVIIKEHFQRHNGAIGVCTSFRVKKGVSAPQSIVADIAEVSAIND